MPRRIPPAAPGQKPKGLQDPCGDRAVKEAPVPPAQLLNGDVLFNSKGIPDVEMLKAHFNLEGALAQEALLDIIRKAAELFSKEPNLLKLNDPITVVGDIHGQYYDLNQLLQIGGSPADGQYIFLGDYVDRGSFSVEATCLLFSYKIAYPNRVRMLRGNHECRQLTNYFNFREECEYKYDDSVYQAFMEAFDTLPLAATINGKFFAVHGGLSPDIENLRAITRINRFQETPKDGPIADLLWADPYDQDGEKLQKGINREFVPNQTRGCSYYYSIACANRFLQKNSLLSVVRAHEAQLEGYKMHRTNPATNFPSVITIFSAPNYCDVYNNKGAIMKLDNSTLNVLQFNCSPHPYHLPDFMDIFAWSVPFLVEKVTEMLHHVIQPSAWVELGEESPLPASPQDATMAQLGLKDTSGLSEEEMKTVFLAKQLSELSFNSAPKTTEAEQEAMEARDRMRKKVRTVARMAKMFKTLREEHETIIALKGACPGHRVDSGLIFAGKNTLKSELQKYEHVVEVDSRNEARPDDDEVRRQVSSGTKKKFSDIADLGPKRGSSVRTNGSSSAALSVTPEATGAPELRADVADELRAVELPLPETRTPSSSSAAPETLSLGECQAPVRSITGRALLAL